MKLDAAKTSSIFSVMLLVFLFSAVAKAQTIQLTENDKFQIITEILKKQELKWDTAYSPLSKSRPKNTIYLLADNLPAVSFPPIKNVNFEVITQKEINDSTETISYYQFGDFEVKQDSVKVVFSRMSKRSEGKISDIRSSTPTYLVKRYTFDTAGHINDFHTGESIEYKGKKNLDGWKVKEHRVIVLGRYDPFGQTPSKYDGSRP